MTALIELICSAHRDPDPVGPLITRIDGMWAYCDGRGLGDHDWTRVQPTRRELLGNTRLLQDRRAS